MEESPISKMLSVQNVWATSLCFLVFVCLFYYFRRPQNIPPGPRRWPLIGNLPTVVYSAWRKEHVHDLMTRLSKKYGKVFSLDFGGTTRVIILNDTKVIREAFQKPELSDRVPSAVLDQVSKGKGVLISGGEVWKHQRRFSLAVFRSFGVGKSTFDDQIATEASVLCDEISRLYTGKLFDPRKLLMNATSNMICSILLGKRFDYTDAEFHHLLSILDERIKLIGGGALQAQVPLLRMLNRKKIEKLLHSIRKKMSIILRKLSRSISKYGKSPANVTT
ncbi:cytochrome P450 2J6-like [Amphiura filiformis]|uniref:cytochrome P450 2J6-like n=1 Tax=Amphiura filiformis TaxID=82378 RepID=UPI003B2232C2